MTVEVGIILSIISVGIAIATFFMNNKKTNKNDGFEVGSFFGEIKSEISNIKSMIEELKEQTKSLPREFDEKITKAIDEHEKRYHKES